MKIFIPIKKESQRVPNKNFRPFNGLPLYQYVITKLSKEFEVHIDTDSNEILEWCQTITNVFGYKRKEKNVGHTNPVTDLIYDFIIDNNIINEKICQLHITSPLLEIDTIIGALNCGYDNVIGCDIIYNRFWENKNGKMIPLNHNPNELKQTQDLDPLYLENSSFYIFNSDEFLKTKNRIGNDPHFYEVNYPQNLDIDTEDDWDLIKKYEIK